MTGELDRFTARDDDYSAVLRRFAFHANECEWRLNVRLPKHVMGKDYLVGMVHDRCVIYLWWSGHQSMATRLEIHESLGDQAKLVERIGDEAARDVMKLIDKLYGNPDFGR